MRVERWSKMMGVLLGDSRRARYALWRQGRIPNPRNVMANRQWSIWHLLLLTSLVAVACAYFGSQLSLRVFLTIMVMLGVVLGADRKPVSLRPLGRSACGGCIGGVAAAVVGTLLVICIQPAINESTIRTAAKVLLRMGLAAILLGISYGVWLDGRWLNQETSAKAKRRPDAALSPIAPARRTIHTRKDLVGLWVGIAVSLLVHIVYFTDIHGYYDSQSRQLDQTNFRNDLVISLEPFQPSTEAGERTAVTRIPAAMSSPDPAHLTSSKWREPINERPNVPELERLEGSLPTEEFQRRVRAAYYPRPSSQLPEKWQQLYEQANAGELEAEQAKERPGHKQRQENDAFGRDDAAGFRIIDGRIHLVGTIRQLKGVEVISRLGRLSMETIQVRGLGKQPLRLPYDQRASVVVNNPRQVVIGVLAVKNRIDVEGATPTSVLYAGDNPQADLTVNIGFGEKYHPITIQWIPESLPTGRQ